ncbi:MAG: serine--tRNA ligase [Candidatus Marinimicrobia bacterium]|nr:serine--tRNA ligase [Candidatus Neomarinimicrobiota bacterium]
MLDIKWIRDNSDTLDTSLARRGVGPVAAELLDLDKRLRAVKTDLQLQQGRRKDLSKKIGLDRAKGGEVQSLVDEVSAIKKKMTELEDEERCLSERLQSSILVLPNIPHELVPEGRDESANVELRRWNTETNFDFEVKDHADLGIALGLMDFEQAAAMSGAIFVVLKGQLALLERAIAQFMLDIHTIENGYTEINPPLLVYDGALIGTGQLPKFSEDLFKATTGHWLIPTAEVPLTNLVAGKITSAGKLPLRFTASTPCFRSEAGAAGKDTKGMIRSHQFEKVELVSIVVPQDSDSELERMTGCAESILQKLELPYRVVELCTGDMGFSAARTYDLEVWLPSQKTYREISSCSNAGDFQARRMNARYRPAEETKGARFLHTLNGSGLAVGRTLVAIMENYQQRDGTIRVPEVLKRYMGGLNIIGLEHN